ncbi:hypothetical protein K4F52_008481 [Lecanicillium sp. MT-2017a]|nr:hypothetical protein K4F52_008481 [Lecanicillium sp. MT-2017a]
MRLCQVCEAIPFEVLPAFPQNDYEAGLTGKEYIQRFTRNNWSLSRNAGEETASVKHHASLESLRETASNGCELCKLIQKEAEKLLVELDGLEDRPDGRGKPYPSPSFDMWLTQRPEGGRGFWVVSEPSQGTGGRVILPIAAFGIVVEEALAFRLPLAKEVIRSRYIEMREEPISKGVWSFQERVLSSRVVHFASDQVYVECMRQFVSEDGLLERQRYHTTAETLPDGTRHHFSQELIRSPKEGWFDMLWDYARREPVVSTDKLTALSNVARAFQKMLDGGRGEYIAGHWKDSLLESLCWQSLKCKPAGDSDAPSWSWISVEGIPAMGFGTDIPSYLATVVATHVNLQDATNPFGRVTEASITLEAPPLIPLRIVEEHEFGEGSNVFGQVYVQSESEGGESIYAGLDTMDRRLAVSASALREMKLFALVLAETRPDGECRRACPGSEETLHGLIVTPAQAAGEKTMRRLGFFLADRSDLGPSSLFDGREVTTLV